MIDDLICFTYALGITSGYCFSKITPTNKEDITVENDNLWRNTGSALIESDSFYIAHVCKDRTNIHNQNPHSIMVGWCNVGNSVSGYICIEESGSEKLLAKKTYPGTDDGTTTMFVSSTVDVYGNIYCIGLSLAREGVSVALIVKFSNSLSILAICRFDNFNYHDFQKVSIDNEGNVICVGNCTIEKPNDGVCVVRLTSGLKIIDSDVYRPE